MSRSWTVACLLVAAAACGPGEAVVSGSKSGDAGVERDTGNEADAEVDAAPLDPELPAACIGETPGSSEACGTALAERCHAFKTERDCESADVIEDAYRYVCGWAKVTTFSDASTCAVASVEGRCEAYLGLGAGCGCSAVPAKSVIVQSHCRGIIGPLSGPIDRGYSLEVQRTEPRETYLCGPGLAPPAPPICACIEECGQ